MTEIFDWIRQMIFLSLFLTLLLQILPDGSYRKYVRFFAGLVFVITLLNPVMQIFMKENWEDRILTEVFAEEKIREQELDFSYMEERQRELFGESMDEAVTELVREAAKTEGVSVRKVETEYDRESGEIKKIKIRIRESGTEKADRLREKTAGMLAVEDSRVEVTDS